MKAGAQNYFRFLRRCIGVAFLGDWRYYAWMGALTLITLVGINAYAKQFVEGLGVTGMTDHVSWGVYIANYTYLVGIATAAVILVIAVYVYRHQEWHDVAIFGQLLAVAAIIMSLAFVMVDLGQPLQSWHMLPIVGKFNFPQSLLSWDVIVLAIFLLLNLHICGYLLYCRYNNRKPRKWFSVPFVFVSMFWAISTHAVTAFLHEGLGGRPYWNTAIVAPRFIASAFVSGAAFLIIALQVIRRVTDYKFDDQALLMLRRVVQISLIVNVFFFASELFTEFYSETLHNSSATYLYLGLEGHNALVPWIWTAVGFNLIAMVLLMSPLTQRIGWLDVACVLAIVGIWIEKGMGQIVAGFIPTPLGQIVEYTPTFNETAVCLGIWAFGLLCFTVFLRMSVPIVEGKLNKANEEESGYKTSGAAGLSGASAEGA